MTLAMFHSDVFTLSQLEATDRAPEAYPVVYLTRISPRERETKMYLMSDIKNRDYRLGFEV